MSLKYCIWCGVEMEQKDDICANCEKEQKSRNSHTKDFLIKYSKKKVLDSIKDKSKDKLSALLLGFIKSHLWGTILVISALIALIVANLPEPQLPVLATTSTSQVPTTKPGPVVTTTNTPAATPEPTVTVTEEPSPSVTTVPTKPVVETSTYSPQADKYGAIGGGVIILNKDDKYGAISYEGKVLTDYLYSECLYGPTADGYYILGDWLTEGETTYYKFDVFDKNGNILLTEKSLDYYDSGIKPAVVISEGYIQYVSADIDTENIYYSIYNIATKKLTRTLTDIGFDYGVTISGFTSPNGYLYIISQYEAYRVSVTGEMTSLYHVDSHKAEGVMLADGKTYNVCAVVSSNAAESDGYTAALGLDFWYTRGEETPALMGLYDSANDSFMFIDLSVFCETENLDVYSLAFGMYSGDAKYTNRGTEIIVCGQTKDTDTEKRYVFNLAKGNYSSVTEKIKIASNVEDMLRSFDVEGKKVSCFDSIWLSDENIYLAELDGKECYLTEDGTCEMYADGSHSRFVNGYAIILENDTVYLIDTNFEKVKTLAQVGADSYVWNFAHGFYYVDKAEKRLYYVMTN